MSDGVLNATLSTVATVQSVTMNGIKIANVTNVSGGAAGFAGSITGLTTLNSIGSTGQVNAGQAGQGLLTPLTNLNITANAQGAGAILANVVLAASVGAAANTLTVGLNTALGAAGAGLADTIQVSTDGAAGTPGSPNLAYGTEVINATTGKSFIQLQSNGGVDGATTIKVTGAGSLTLSADLAATHSKVTTIDASGSTGSLYVSGALGSVHGGTGGVAGFLTGDAALTSFKGTTGTGTNILDVSNLTAATTAGGLGALTANATTSTATNNDIDVSNAALDTLVAGTWANISGFQIAGVNFAAGAVANVVNDALLPTAINTILFMNVETAGSTFTLNNLTSTFTLDTETFGGVTGVGLPITVGAVGPNAGLSDTINLIVGSSTAAGFVGAVMMNGEENVNYVVQGASGAAAASTDQIGTSFLTSTAFSLGETVGIKSGAGTLGVAIFGAYSTTGAIFDVAAGGATLIANNMSITDTSSNYVVFNPATTGIGATTDYSNNAYNINAATSGGLIMQAGDANFTAGAAPSLGDAITGSTTAGNVLIGSLGNDTIIGTTGTTLGLNDTIVTDGGADIIKLAAGHVTGDTVGFYMGYNAAVTTLAGALAPGAVSGAVGGSIAATNDVIQAGYWGLGPTGVAAAHGGVAANTGVSTDQSTITGFVAGTAATPVDTLDFSKGAYTATGTGHGLVNGALTAAASGASTAQVYAGGGAVIAAATTLVELTGSFFTTANDVVTYLHGAPNALTLTGVSVVGDFYHFVVAYSDIGLNTHIMDLDVTGTAGNTTATGTIYGSDVAVLTGISIVGTAGLHAGNVVFVA